LSTLYPEAFSLKSKKEKRNMHQIIPVENNRLRPYLHSYNHFELNVLELNNLASSNKMVPDALADIWIITHNDWLHSLDNREYELLPKVMVWGLFNTCSYMKSAGVVEIFSIKIHPWAFGLFFDRPLLQLQNSFCALDTLLPEQMILSLEDVFKLEEIGEKIKYFETLLLRLLDNNKKPNDIVVSAYRKIVESEANIKITDLASELKVSRQHLNSSFKREVGLTLKEYITIFRMRLCIDFQLNNHLATMTDLAYRFDFFDQSHFIHQFKKIAGETPRAFFGKRHIIKQHL
jgi:AraC-like DNA-binding protein